MSRSLSALLAACLAGGLLLALAAPAGAHGELEAAKPGPNDHLKAPPSNLTMTFTEEPSNDSVIKVSDGCHSSVVERLVVDGNDFVAQLAKGQPGTWQASFRVISAEDGHLTKGNYTFEVAGEKDCSKGGDGKGNGDGATDGPDDGPSVAAPGDGDDDGGDFPVVPVVIAAVVLVGAGIVLRRASAR